MHTKGPWKAPENLYRITSKNNIICIVEHTFITRDEFEANRKLIAAAPDLVEALESLVHWYEVDDERYCGELMKVAKEAIKKARGL